MKKYLLFSFFVLSTTYIKAQVSLRISVANGSWNNPATWSPAGVPNPADDSIVVNTAVTINQNIADGLSMFRITPNGSLIDLGADTIALGGDYAVIDGYMSCSELAVGMTFSLINSGTISIADGLAQSGTFVNAATGSICVGNLLATSDNFTNNGSIAADSWTNSGLTTGSGRFCIANFFINVQTITGTLDICDATPGTPMDINAGSIAGTVTNCTASPCNLCPQPNGINEHFDNGAAVAVYPNPFADQFTVELKNAFLSPMLDTYFELYDANGRCVRKEKMNSTTISVERNELPEGIYLWRMTANGKQIANGKLMAE